MSAPFVTVLFEGRQSPPKVTIACMTAMNAAKKGLPAVLVLMVEGVKLAVPGGLDGIDVGAPFKPAKELLEVFLAAGGKVLACASCLELARLKKEDLDPRFGVITGPEVVDLLASAGGSLQVT